jgi:putative tryptophan/tyrosine transport system substrate-binding protein
MGKLKITEALFAALLVASTLTVEAQTPNKIPTVGFLRLTRQSEEPKLGRLEEFRQGLRQLGYIEGQNILLELRWAEDKLVQVPALMNELVRLNPDVIVTHGPAGARAAKEATSTIPVVIARMDDADIAGFVTTLARPGGNITGLSFQSGEVSGKLLDLLKESRPKTSRVAVLMDKIGTVNQLKTLRNTALSAGVHLQLAQVQSVKDFPTAFDAILKPEAEGLVILGSPLFTNNTRQLAALATKHRMPGIYYNRRFAEAGGLMAYGPDESDPSWGYRRAAVYVDKILKGTKPADLPVEQPTRFEFVINLKAAKQIGVTIPANLLARADTVIK